MRAKRLNAEKVTITLDSDVLLSAKHKALDEHLTLSDYIQNLIKNNIGQELFPRLVGEAITPPVQERQILDDIITSLGHKKAAVKIPPVTEEVAEPATAALPAIAISTQMAIAEVLGIDLFSQAAEPDDKVDIEK